jgi:hypothetical protein
MTPANSTPGGLVSQLTSFGNFKISDDEAAVITISSGGAAYFSLVLHDFTARALDARRSIVSLNAKQVAYNDDGTVSYVVAKQDPGACNWIDTQGWNEVYPVLRWQAFPSDDPLQNSPSVTTTIAKLSELRKIMPKETRWLSAKEREEQVARHLGLFMRRYAER